MNVHREACMRNSNVWNRLSILAATEENQENLVAGPYLILALSYVPLNLSGNSLQTA
jgi:hypothetical protein